MSTTRGCLRFRPDEGDERERGALEQQADAEHLQVCPDCREEMKGTVVQRATVRGVYQSIAATVPLSEKLVTRCLDAMKRAARDQRDSGEEGDLGRSVG